MTMSTSVTQPTEIRASGQLSRWRTIDLLTCAFLGVAFGVAYWAWGLAYEAPSNAVSGRITPARDASSSPRPFCPSRPACAGSRSR